MYVLQVTGYGREMKEERRGREEEGMKRKEGRGSEVEEMKEEGRERE
jgi:hypothetical protein